MNNLLFRYLFIIVVLLFSHHIHATTFAKRHHYEAIIQTGSFQQLEVLRTDIQKNLKKWQKKKDKRQEAEYTGLLTECLMAQGQYKEAMKYAQRAKDMYKKLLDNPANRDNLLLHYDYAQICCHTADLATSLVYDRIQVVQFYKECSSSLADYCQRVYSATDDTIKEQHKDRLYYSKFSLMWCYVMLSMKQHDFADAVKMAEDILSDITNAYPNDATSRNEYINTQIMLSLVYVTAQNYEQGLYYLQQAMTNIENTYGKNNFYYALALYRLGGIYYSLHNYKEAQKYFSLCNDVFEKTGFTRHALYAEFLLTMGNFCLSKFEKTEANDYYHAASQRYLELFGEDSYQYYLSKYMSSYIHLIEKNYAEGMSVMKELLSKDVFYRDAGDSHVIAAYSLFFDMAYRSNNYADIYNNVPKVDKYIRDNRQKVGLFEACRLYIAIGRAYRNNSKYIKASTYFHKALEFIREMARRNFAFLSEEQRTDFWERDRTRMEGILWQNPFPDDAQGSLGKLLYDAVLLRKGILLNTSVNMAKIIEEKGPESLKHDMRRLQLMMQSNLNTAEGKQEYHQLEQYVQKETRKYGDFMNFVDYTWTDVKKSLNSNDVAIEFVCSQQVGINSLSAEILSNKWNVPQHVSLFWYIPEKLKSVSELNELLQEAICQKIVPLLKPGDNVYFSPAVELHMLPIEYMTLPNGKRMDEVYHMYRVSSTRELINKREKRATNKNITLFGGLNYNVSPEDMELQAMAAKDRSRSKSSSNRSTQWSYLPGTMKEVQGIAHIMRGSKYKVSVFTQEEGVEEQFKALSETHTGIIHIATHGFYEPAKENEMEHAGLIFAGANNFWTTSYGGQQNMDNGILTASEIANLNLIGTDLVVLSACQTGLGKVSGEGIFGLQRAFKKAGVQSILMSLWKVDDEATQVLMTAFYKYLKAGNSKHEALGKAQAQVRKKYFILNGKKVSGEDIHYWGGFVLID